MLLEKADNLLAMKIYRWLRDQAISVWFDRIELRPGDSLMSKIASGITGANFLLVLITENSKRSQWVEKEVSIALTLQIKGTGPTVIPILLKGCEIPTMLADKFYISVIEQDTDFPEIISAIFNDSYRMDVALCSDNLQLDETILMEHLNEYMRSTYQKIRVFINNHDFNKKVSEIATKSHRIKTNTPAENIETLKKRIREKSIWFHIHLPLYWVNLSQLLSQLTFSIFRLKNLNSVYFAFYSIDNTMKYCHYIMSSYLLQFPLFIWYAEKLGFNDIVNYATFYVNKFKEQHFPVVGNRNDDKEVLADIFECSKNDLAYVDIISKNPKLNYVTIHLPDVSNILQAPYTYPISEILTEDLWHKYCIPRIIGKVLIETVFRRGKPLHELDYYIGLKISDYDRIGYN